MATSSSFRAPQTAQCAYDAAFEFADGRVLKRVETVCFSLELMQDEIVRGYQWEPRPCQSSSLASKK